MNRYARQTLIIGDAGAEALSRARVLVVGAGGLAAPALPVLAGAGVGSLTILDPDRVEVTNLHRQTLFTEADIGQPKARVAAKRCAALNSEIEIMAEASALTPANVDYLVAAHDVILDCADSYAASYTLSDACHKIVKPLLTASVLGQSGYVAALCGGGPSLRAVFPDAPTSGASCATAGVLGPVVAMLGAAQAQMALQTVLGQAPLGTLIQIDAATWHMTKMDVSRATEPATAYPFVTPTDTDIIVDLRDEAEAPTPIHSRALRAIPAPQNARLVLACATGLRAWRAAETTQWPGDIALAAASTT